MKNYSVETRREVIRLYFQEGLGARRIVKRLDLSSTALVRQWVIKYIEYGEDSFVRKRRRVAPSECSIYEYQNTVTYLRDRAAKPCRFAAPAGWYYEKSGVHRQGDIVKETMLALDDEKITKLRQFFEKELSEYDDLITAEQVAAFLGYHKSTAVYWCEKRRIKSFKVSAKYLIPKICLVDFLVSPESFFIHQKSLIHRQLLWEFLSSIGE